MTIRLTDYDLPHIGRLIGVGEDEVHAVLEVESRGSGFDSKGRVVILFEPHVFYRLLTDPKQRAAAVRIGVAYQKWGTKSYPSDSYPRLKAAMKINPEAAMKSCSWGLGQIMGENHVLAGYEEVGQMVDHFKTGEAAQLLGMINFIRNTSLDDELRDHNWAAFARGYNGPSYAKHGYHTRLEKAYQKWAKIKDTAYP